MDRVRHAGQVVLFLVIALSAGAFGSGPPAAPARAERLAALVAWPTSTVLVSEVMTGGTSASDEFAEITNAGAVPIDLTGHELVYVTSTGSTVTRKAAWSTPTILEPGRHLLVANVSGIHAAIADATYSGGFAATGGAVVLRPIGGEPVDAVGWGDASSAFVEGAAAPAPASGSSIERLPGGSLGNGTDTNDNLSDFVVRTPPFPQNLGAAPTPLPAPTPTPGADSEPDADADAGADSHGDANAFADCPRRRRHRPGRRPRHRPGLRRRRQALRRRRRRALRRRPLRRRRRPRADAKSHSDTDTGPDSHPDSESDRRADPLDRGGPEPCRWLAGDGDRDPDDWTGRARFGPDRLRAGRHRRDRAAARCRAGNGAARGDLGPGDGLSWELLRAADAQRFGRFGARDGAVDAADAGRHRDRCRR